jgi:arginine repressor
MGLHHEDKLLCGLLLFLRPYQPLAGPGCQSCHICSLLFESLKEESLRNFLTPMPGNASSKKALLKPASRHTIFPAMSEDVTIWVVERELETSVEEKIDVMKAMMKTPKSTQML